MLNLSPEILSLLWGAAIGALIFTGHLTQRWWNLRQLEQRRPSFELTPNCLLTRLPVLLITEPGNEPHPHRFEMIYQMLKEHGYKTEWVKIPVEFESNEAIKKQLQDLLHELSLEGLSFHIFIAPELVVTFSQVVESMPKAKTIAVSITALEFPNPRKVLDRAVELAEQDFIGPTQNPHQN